jgi:hypothetical protein
MLGMYVCPKAIPPIALDNKELGETKPPLSFQEESKSCDIHPFILDLQMENFVEG